MEQTNQECITPAAFENLPPDSQFERNGNLLSGRLDLIRDVNVTLDARVGGCELSVAELSRLKNGDVLTLDRAPDEPIDILLNGTVIARGRLVVAGEYFGIRVEEITGLTL